MSLANYQIQREEVTFMGGSLSLRGLSLNDISALMFNYLDQLEHLFGMYSDEEQKETAMQESAKFAVTIVRECPKMVAQLIILAGDEPQELFEIAERLPIPVQVEAIRKVFELTFLESGGAKKFVDGIVAVVRANRPAAKQD